MIAVGPRTGFVAFVVAMAANAASFFLTWCGTFDQWLIASAVAWIAIGVLHQRVRTVERARAAERTP